MKNVIFPIFLTAFIWTGSAFAEEAATYGSPQEAAPNIYTQLLDNESVTVSEITFKPGDKAAMHTHAYPHAVYILEGGQLTLTHPDGTNVVMDAKPGQVVWMGPETHEAVNTGTTTVRATVTEIKSK